MPEPVNPPNFQNMTEGPCPKCGKPTILTMPCLKVDGVIHCSGCLMRCCDPSRPEPEDPVAAAKRLLAAGEAHHAELLAISPRLLAALCDRLAEVESGDNCPRCEEVQCGACGGTGEHWNPVVGAFIGDCYACKGEGVLVRPRQEAAE